MTLAPIPGHVAEQQLYHGTSANIPVGGAVVPGKEAGISHYGKTGRLGQKSNEHAFATTHEDTAWNFANNASMKTGDRAKVLTVTPGPDTKPGAYNSEHPKHRLGGGSEDLHEYVSQRFPVTGQVDIKPEHQGTFPQINWRQHSTLQSWAGDPNHPDPHEVENGHYGSSISSSHMDSLIAHNEYLASPESKELPGQTTLFNDRRNPITDPRKIQVD